MPTVRWVRWGSCRAWTCAWVIAIFLAALPARAQIISGDLVVRVVDPSDLIVTGAALGLSEVETGIAHMASTDAQGTYLFGQLKPGLYRLEASAQGFRTTTVQDIRIQVGQRARVEVKLVVDVSEQVNVSAAAATLLNAESAAIGQVMDSRTMVELPLNGRNFIQVAQLDHQIGGRDQVYGTFSSSDETRDVKVLRPYGGEGFPLSNQLVTVTHAHTFSPVLLNEFRFGYNRSRTYRLAETSYGRDFAREEFHLRNTTDQAIMFGIPAFNIAGLGGIGSISQAIGALDENLQFTDNLSLVRGNHNPHAVRIRQPEHEQSELRPDHQHACRAAKNAVRPAGDVLRVRAPAARQRRG